jgi:hypothetical protein
MLSPDSRYKPAKTYFSEISDKCKKLDLSLFGFYSRGGAGLDGE